MSIEAAAAAIKAAWPAGRVYVPNGVPDTPQTPYVVVYGDAGRDDARMLDASAGADATRLMPMAVGKTHDELTRASAAVIRGLRGKRLEVDGFDCTPLVLESTGGTVRDPDGGSLLSLTLYFTFTTFAKETP